MNDVVKSNPFGGKMSIGSTAALKDALAQSAATDPRGGAANGASYMNFSGKRGAYEIGTSKRGLKDDELFLVNIAGFEDGWICWKDGSPKAKRMYPLGVHVPEPDFEEFGPFQKDGDGWYQAKAMVAKSIDEDEQVHWTINSISGVSTMAALQKEITARLRVGEPCWPVITLASEPFTSKGYKNYKPTITIDGWLNDEQVMETLPALMADENAEIDMEALYAEAEGIAPTSQAKVTKEAEAPKEEPKTETVGRRRRSI